MQNKTVYLVALFFGLLLAFLLFKLAEWSGMLEAILTQQG